MSLIDRPLHLLGVALFHLRLHRAIIWLGRNNPKILLYHDCSESESAYTNGLECTVSPAAFRRHIEYVCKYYRFVDLTTLEEGLAPERSVAVTFDDGYRSVYENAFPVLRSHRLPATIYLVTDVIGNERMVWVNELNFYLHTFKKEACRIAAACAGIAADSAPQEIVTRLLTHYDAEKTRTLLNTLREKFSVSAEALSRTARLYVDWEQIAEMQGDGVSFGNHTMSHPNLAALTEDEQRREIEGAQHILVSRLGVVRSMSYPFGHRSRSTPGVAVQAGVRSLAEVGGLNNPQRPLRLGRVHVTAESEAGLFAQMEIVEPIKAYLRRWCGLDLRADSIKASPTASA